VTLLSVLFSISLNSITRCIVSQNACPFSGDHVISIIEKAHLDAFSLKLRVKKKPVGFSEMHMEKGPRERLQLLSQRRFLEGIIMSYLLPQIISIMIIPFFYCE
jgi:hypothetical protein